MKWQLHEWLRQLGLFACMNTIELKRKDGKRSLVVSLGEMGPNVGEVEIDEYKEGQYNATYTLEYVMESLDNLCNDPDWLDLFSDNWEIDDSSWNTICGNMNELNNSFQRMREERIRADREEN